jgi:hypothetical protein
VYKQAELAAGGFMTIANDTVSIVFGPCCFCGKQIAETEIDPCQVTVSTATEKWQTWFCHGACFKERLAALPDSPGFFDPAHF